MPSKIIFLFCILFLKSGFSFGQKNIIDYYNRVFPNGVSFEQTVTDTIIDLENDFFEYNYKDGNYHAKLFQAKLIRAKKGNDILMFIQEFSDMQCNYQKQWMFEIDKKTDSLISVPFLRKFKINGYEDFVEIDSIKNIFKKYTDSLQSYLGEENNLKQFLEELYEYNFEFDRAGDMVFVNLRFCDYIPRNIVGFTDDELEYLNITYYPFFEYQNRSRKFKEIRKVLVKF